MSYNVCPDCGASLDPGERCEDCVKEREEKRNRIELLNRNLTVSNNGQYRFIFGDSERKIV